MILDFDNLFQTVKDGVTEIIKGTVKDYTEQMLSEGQSILDEMETDLQEWTVKVKNGIMDKDDFMWLLGSQKVLLEMAAIKQSGISQAELDKIKTGITDLIVNTVFGLIP